MSPLSAITPYFVGRPILVTNAVNVGHRSVGAILVIARDAIHCRH
jgi:hypothetical protein